MQVSYPMEALSACPLFRDVSPDILTALLSEPSVRHRAFESGEEIPTSYDGERALILLTKGFALAYSSDEKKEVLLRTIRPGMIFGVSVLFSEDAPVSVIRAKVRAEALCFPAPAVRMLLERSEVFRMNYITFLSGRIRFLNRRIACYTAGCAERRLALYLSELTSDTTASATLDLSMTELSELLDIGRASLYRAFARLTELGLIERSDRRIHVPNRRALLTYVEKNETV